jgi:hexosaminidase
MAIEGVKKSHLTGLAHTFRCAFTGLGRTAADLKVCASRFFHTLTARWFTRDQIRFFVATLMVGAGVAPFSLRAQQPQLIPQPREVQTKTVRFTVTPGMQILVVSPVGMEDHFAAESLQEELELVTGHKYPIATTTAAPSAGTASILLGRLDQSPIRGLVDSRRLRRDGIPEQGYLLDVEPGQVLVAGKDGPGLFYGVQTLRQLVAGQGSKAEIIGVSVRDWPSLPYRGTQVDVARGLVPKLDYLKRIVRTIAEFKMNQLYMYMEESFRLDGQPLVGLLSDTLSRNDWNELVAYAKPYHVDIVPANEDCGHLHKMLRFEQYSGLAERPHGHVLAPDEPKTVAFLESMYAQMVPVFTTPMYNIGCDETVELGLGRSAGRVAKEGYGQVYVDNLIKVADLVRRYNKQVMFWGDIAVEHPELIPKLPHDLIVASWEYSVHPNYNKWLKPFEGTGMKIFVCPWVGNTNLMMPDYQGAAANIQTFLADGKEAGAIGTDVTVWNDDGESLYGLNWWSILYGAACSWEPDKTPVDDFYQKFDWAFYRNTDHRFAAAIKSLSHINEIWHASGIGQVEDLNFGGTDDSLFWNDPFSPEGRAEVVKGLPVAAAVRGTAEDAYAVFAENGSLALRNSDTLANLKFAALKLDALGMRYQFVQEISQLYANALAHQHDKDQSLVENELGEIESTNGRLEDLRDYTTRLRELYKELWLAENLPNWLPNILQLYDRNSQLWQERIARFAAIQSERGKGKPLPPADSLGLLPVSATK